MAEFKEIAIADIHVPERAREIDQAHALVISASIQEVGQLQPIVVRKTPNGKQKFTLVIGGHRLTAKEIIGHEKIEAKIVNAGTDEAVLVEVSENIFRNDLSILDRAKHVEIYRSLWEKKYGKIKPGKDQRDKLSLRPGIMDNLSIIEICEDELRRGFSEVCAEKLGLSPKSIQRAHRIAQNLTPTVRKAVQGTAIADNQSALLKLAALEPKDQKKVAVALEKTGGDFKQSMALLDGGKKEEPDPQQVLFDRLVDTWSRANDETKANFTKFINSKQEDKAAK